MKTANRENPNRWTTVSSTRVHGAAVQNRSRSIMGAGKQEKLRPQEVCFFLTSPFIELYQVEKAFTARFDVRTVLDVVRRPESFRGRIIALVEECVERFQDEGLV